MLTLLRCVARLPAGEAVGFPSSVCMCEPMAKTDQPTTIKKYANRRLYNTGTSTYVTLEDLAAMVKEGEDFLVYDAKTGDDITRSVFAQIIFEQEDNVHAPRRQMKDMQDRLERMSKEPKKEEGERRSRDAAKHEVMRCRSGVQSAAQFLVGPGSAVHR